MRYAKEIVSLAVIVGLFLTPCVIEAQCSKRDITGKCINNISEPIAQTDSQTIEPEWGTSYTTCKSIPANTFVPFDSSMTWYDDGYGWIVRTGGSYWFNANVDLPTGAKVWNMYVNVYDDSASADVWAWFVECTTDYEPIFCTFYPLDNSLKTNGTPGSVKLYQSLSGQNITIDNLNKTYFVRVNLEATDWANSFGSVQVCYALQISPAPGTATFWDVPVGSFWHQYVEALAASGITTGYGDGTFRPDNYVTRGQMAAFFSRALGLHWPH